MAAGEVLNALPAILHNTSSDRHEADVRIAANTTSLHCGDSSSLDGSIPMFLTLPFLARFQIVLIYNVYMFPIVLIDLYFI